MMGHPRRCRHHQHWDLIWIVSGIGTAIEPLRGEERRGHAQSEGAEKLVVGDMQHGQPAGGESARARVGLAAHR